MGSDPRQPIRETEQQRVHTLVLLWIIAGLLLAIFVVQLFRVLM
jgi:predicted nucleic acid-binding Zn ribbon protein